MTGSRKLRNHGRTVPSPRGAKAGPAEPDAPDLTLRKTGIRFASEMPWGSHICMFFDTKEDLLDTLAGYFRVGLENNEFCVWALSEPVTLEEAKNYLRREIPKFDERLSAGQIEILDGREFYLKGDQFDLQRITGGWNERLKRALARGYDGMRVSGNAFWVETNHWKEFCQYELELDKALTGQKMLVLCTYPF